MDLAKVHRLKGLTFPYIIFYLHFLNLNNILALPQTLVAAEARFGLTQMMFALFFACQTYTHARWFTKSKQMQALHIRAPIEMKAKYKVVLLWNDTDVCKPDALLVFPLHLE